MKTERIQDPGLVSELRQAERKRPVALSNTENRRIIGRLLVRITVTRLRLFAKGFAGTQQRIAADLASPSDAFPTRAQIERSVRAGRIAIGLGRRLRLGRNCLVQSMALWWFLRGEGIPVELRIGVDKTDGDLAAHAWVTLLGEPINDTAEAVSRFSSFDRLAI